MVTSDTSLVVFCNEVANIESLFNSEAMVKTFCGDFSRSSTENKDIVLVESCMRCEKDCISHHQGGLIQVYFHVYKCYNRFGGVYTFHNI